MRTISRFGVPLFALTLAAVACEAPVSAPDPQTDTTSAALVRPMKYVAVNGSDTLPGGGPNDCSRRSRACKTIQHAIDVAIPRQPILIGPGQYREDLVVTKPIELRGHGEDTILVPATSAPNPCTDSALCGGAATSVILVRANDVLIRRLVVDGDDPTHASGVVVNGADIDARNGVITDDTAGTFPGSLSLQEVTVRNVYYRGIQESAGGGLEVLRSRVTNVDGDLVSIGIFIFHSHGIVQDNQLSQQSAGIVANWSTGSLIQRNTITQSAYAVHTDNTVGPGIDLLEDNVITACSTNGFGVFVFAPGVAPIVRKNSVSGCLVGFSVFGGRSTERTLFDGNTFDGGGLTGGAAFQATTDQVGYGAGFVYVDVTGNVLARSDVGVDVQETQGRRVDMKASCNAIVHDTYGVSTNGAGVVLHQDSIVNDGTGVDATQVTSGTVDATSNYWGCAAGPGQTGCDGAAGPVDTSSPLAAPPACVPATSLLTEDVPATPHARMRTATGLARAVNPSR
jgi:nitrous oxidase accessory protein NosD